MKEYLLEVSAEQSGARLDIFLTDFFNSQKLGYSRTFIKELITQGKVISQGQSILKSHVKVKTGQGFKVIVEDKKPHVLGPEDIPLKVVYEDDDLAVIDKAAGIVVHPAPGNYEHTMVNALLHRFKQLSDINPVRPGIVHRLDKETSGLLVIAKNNFSHHILAAQFAAHTIKRRYIAIVKGRVKFDEDVIELPIGRHPIKRKNMAVNFNESAKFAKTHYRTIKRTDEYSVVELEPFTGRTHQLRVHLAFLGHPILGDAKYGKNNEFARLALHAQYLGFEHPRTKEYIEFSSAIPQELKALMKNKT